MKPRSCSKPMVPHWRWFAAAAKRRLASADQRLPWTVWTSAYLDRNVGGPLLARWGDRYLVGGRKIKADDTRMTSLYWLHEDALHEAVELPSGGDCSYPGFVALSEERGLLSYYSSHEGSTVHLPRRTDRALGVCPIGVRRQVL